ncbi:MAG: PKD domain-containing protein, partial [Candidatus Omnitrophica bacterium]|nr:PKD domain-containing protein [Candidatus Omnitrophota bacterium]
VEHIYACKGTYTASLTVTDNDGKTDTASVSIQVSKAPLKPPTAIISANPTSGDAPLTVSFDGSGSINGDGSIVSYKWVFGDGGIATGAKKTHTYDTKGTYTASLTVTDNNRLKNTASVKITADESGPITKIFNITSPPIWVNDKYPIRTKTIDIPKADEYDLWIQAEYTGESQIGEEYRLQVNGGSIGPIIGDRYNGPNDPTLKWISHGSYNLREGANTITFHKGGQPNRIGTGDPGDWRDYDPSDDPSLWTWYLGGSVHFKAIKIKTSE